MATIKEVASDAGVAVGTVSKVLNGLYVSPENKKKVEASIERLGYQMNYYARGLKTKYTHTIAVIVPDILNLFFSSWVYYVEKEMYRLGYKLLLCQSQRDIKKEAYYLRLASQNKVDGIIGITYNDTEPYISKDIPFVTLDRHFETNVCCVSSDNYYGGELAAETMIRTGSTRLIYIRTGSTLNSETLKRGQGFEAMCKRKNIFCEIMDFGDDENSGKKMVEYLKSHVKQGKFSYDGIYASTDELAVSILEQLSCLGVQVPKDVQVIGHDGLRRMNKGNYIVSSIAQPIEKMAQVCVQNVVKLIHKEPVDPITILPVAFVNGGTTRELLDEFV